MQAAFYDLRYGWRKLMRSPGFTAVAVFTLALGIGANTAIFSAVNSILFRPLPYEDPGRLVLVWNRMTNNDRAPVSGPDFVDYRSETGLFEGFAATDRVFEQALTGDGPPEQIKVGGVTDNFFGLLGVRPFLGRDFTPEDATPIPPGAFQQGGTIPSGALILSHGFWQRRFGGDPEVLGRSVQINGLPMEVVAVMPADFQLHMPTGSGVARQIDAWAPMRFDLSLAQRDFQTYRILARLKPGVSLEQAQAEMDAIAVRHRELHQFHENMGIEIVVAPMLTDIVRHVRSTLLVLLGAVGFVLLIACANVANLMLTRSTARSRELAIRSALGAGRRRIIRQMLTESLLLAGLGGIAGLFLARWGIALLVALRPANLPRTEQIHVDGPVLAFTLGTTLLAALLFGLAPAFLASPRSSAAALRDRSGTAHSRNRLRSVLIAAEVALSLVLLIGAGLMLRSFASLQRAEAGFEADGVMTFSLSLPFTQYSTPAVRAAFFQDLQDRVEALPGVEKVGGVFPLPLGGRLWTGPYGRADQPLETWSENEANFRSTLPGYFEALKAQLLAGRFLTKADNVDQRRVVVVDETMANRTWPGEDAVGQQLGIDLFGTQSRMEVIGVIRNIRHESLQADGRQTVYMPHYMMTFAEISMTIRSSSSLTGLMGPIRSEVEAMDADLPVYNVRSMDSYVSEALGPTRFAMILIGVFAGVAVVLAAVGLYGVIAYSVRQRTQEIGIRMAFGARHDTIIRLVLVQGFRVIGIGIGIGLVASAFLTRAISGLLFGVSATDGVTYLVIALLLAFVATAACYIPALRAARVDPVHALKYE